MNEVAVLGVGGVGGCVAAVLAQRGVRVTCIGRRATVEALRTQGLHLDSRTFGRFTVWPAAAERLDHPVDVLIVATKATALPSALDAIDASLLPNAVVIPLLNGLEHVPQIRARLGPRVAPGSIRIEASDDGPRPRRTHVAVRHHHDRLRSRRAADAAGRDRGLPVGLRAGYPCRRERGRGAVGEAGALAALACTTALSNQPIGVIRADAQWRALLTGAVQDGVAVANACGVPMTVEAQMRVYRWSPGDADDVDAA